MIDDPLLVTTDGQLATDKHITCIDCKKEFVYTARDQEFYKVHGYVEPKRCKACRRIKKARFDDKSHKKTWVGDQMVS